MLSDLSTRQERARREQLDELTFSPGHETLRILATKWQMERDGLVARTVTPTVPPSVDYELTELGRSLAALSRRSSPGVGRTSTRS